MSEDEFKPQGTGRTGARRATEGSHLAFGGAASAAFLAALVDSSDDAIVGKTLDGVIQSWNRAAERLFGYTAEEAVGQLITLIIPPERHSEERVILSRLRNGERIEHFETVRVAKGGEQREISLTVSPIFDEHGTIIGASKIARDIGAQKEAQAKLAASEARFRALADNIAQLAWMTDPGGSMAWYNARLLEFAGGALPKGGEVWPRLQHPDHEERVLAGFRAAIASRQPWEDTFPLRRHDGAWRWFLSRAQPIFDDSGEVVLWFGTNTDITDRMEMEEALREADRRKDEFLATLAHELRNPLAPISTGVHLLRLKAGDDATTQQVLDTLERQTSHLVRMVDDLLDVSRITRGKIELRRERVDLVAVATGAVEASRPLLDAARHRLQLDLPPGPLEIEADPVRIGQVMANLLNNAARYTPAGGEVCLRVEGRGPEAVITVLDNGLGFAPETGEQLFDLFAQGEHQSTGRSGLGIGLTLVRSLAALHGGTVSAHSEGPGLGSSFEVRLPLPVLAPPRESPEPEARAAAGSAPRHSLDVLIADDNRDAADSLRELLELLGHRARTVYSGGAALAATAEQKPQVILLDLGMPGVDGYQTADLLRRRWGAATPVLIALTGWGQAEDRRRTRQAGFDHHLVKPADLTVLRELLDQIGDRLAAGRQDEPAAEL